MFVCLFVLFCFCFCSVLFFVVLVLLYCCTLQINNFTTCFPKINHAFFLSIRLRTDDQLDSEEDGSVICQFLQKCGVEDEIKKDFIKYLRDEANKRGEQVNFTLLRDVINKAEEIEVPEMKEMVCYLVKKRLCKSGVVYIIH